MYVIRLGTSLCRRMWSVYMVTHTVRALTTINSLNHCSNPKRKGVGTFTNIMLFPERKCGETEL